jgi:hypothetical protein
LTLTLEVSDFKTEPLSDAAVKFTLTVVFAATFLRFPKLRGHVILHVKGEG